MARHVLRDAMVTVNAVDLSDHVSSVTVETTRPEVDITSMGADFMETIGGIPDATITVSYFNDYAAGEVDATHWPLVGADTPFAVNVRVTSAAISSTNPEYQMPSALLYNYNPIAGDIGSANTTEVTYRNAGTLGIVRDVTP
jgi:hypothetical protein